MSDCAIENYLSKPNTANSTIISHGVKHSPKTKNNHICPTFLKLLETDSVFCGSCPYNKDLGQTEQERDKLLRLCQDHDCLSSIEVCRDYDCENNIFYKGLRWKKCENQITKLIRNCDLACRSIGGLKLEEISKIYGFTRERCRQISESEMVKIGLRFRRHFKSYIPPDGDKNLQALIDKRKNQAERHDELKAIRLAGDLK